MQQLLFGAWGRRSSPIARNIRGGCSAVLAAILLLDLMFRKSSGSGGDLDIGGSDCGGAAMAAAAIESAAFPSAFRARSIAIRANIASRRRFRGIDQVATATCQHCLCRAARQLHDVIGGVLQCCEFAAGT